MAATQSSVVSEQQEHQQLSGAIAKNVLQLLGKPLDLQRMQVRQLWADHYRVNVFAGGDLSSARVAHSYFLITDATGGIVNSTPAIKKQY